MKKIIFVATIVLAAAVVVPMTVSANNHLAEELSGRILLQVESRGEAWYVYPENGHRYHLRTGRTALGIMESTGLGISDADLRQIPPAFPVHNARYDDPDGDNLETTYELALGTDPGNRDSDGDGYWDDLEIKNGYDPMGPGRWPTNQALVNRLQGKILLQVESRGEAWYLDPVSGTRVYVHDGYQAMEVLRQYGLGISNANLDMIPSGTFNEPLDNMYYPGPAPDETDQDSDGLIDRYEELWGTDPTNPDTDGDGLTDGEEKYTYWTDPLNQDTDGDGYSDYTEVINGYNPDDTRQHDVSGPLSADDFFGYQPKQDVDDEHRDFADCDELEITTDGSRETVVCTLGPDEIGELTVIATRDDNTRIANLEVLAKLSDEVDTIDDPDLGLVAFTPMIVNLGCEVLVDAFYDPALLIEEVSIPLSQWLGPVLSEEDMAEAETLKQELLMELEAETPDDYFTGYTLGRIVVRFSDYEDGDLVAECSAQQAGYENISFVSHRNYSVYQIFGGHDIGDPSGRIRYAYDNITETFEKWEALMLLDSGSSVPIFGQTIGIINSAFTK